MSDFHTRAAPGAVVRAARAASAKAPRRDLVRLTLTADRCPQITLRVLGLLAQRSIIPATIHQAMRTRSLALELVFAADDARQGAIILAKIEQLVGVRRARLTRLR